LAWQGAPAGGLAIIAVDLQSDDPAALSARWAAVLGLPVADMAIVLANATLRFTKAADGRGAGLGGLEMTGLSAPVTLCGTRFTPPR
jgi:hypothetical protein